MRSKYSEKQTIGVEEQGQRNLLCMEFEVSGFDVDEGETSLMWEVDCWISGRMAVIVTSFADQQVRWEVPGNGTEVLKKAAADMVSYLDRLKKDVQQQVIMLSPFEALVL